MNRKEKYTNMALKEAMVGLLMQKDIDKITVTQICERAGINRATFYLRYNTIEEFYAALASEWADEIVEETNERLKNLHGEDILLKSIILPLETIKANRFILPVILKNKSPALFEKTYEMLSEGMSENSERRFRYRFFMEGTKGIMLQWVEDDCREEIEILAEKISSVFRLMLYP